MTDIIYKFMTAAGFVIVLLAFILAILAGLTA